MSGIYIRMPDNPVLDKLIMLADGDVDLVIEASHACEEYRRWRWWQRKRWAADLKNVVAYIVKRKH